MIVDGNSIPGCASNVNRVGIESKMLTNGNRNTATRAVVYRLVHRTEVNAMGRNRGTLGHRLQDVDRESHELPRKSGRDFRAWRSKAGVQERQRTLGSYRT